MTDNKHTSGPWHTRNNPGDWGLPGVIFIEDEKNNILATLDYRTPYCMGESSSVIEQAQTARSNAQLMSAAPDLYEALKEMVAYADSERKGLRIAELALAKAEGK